MENTEKLRATLARVISDGTLKKITLSRPLDKSILRAECRRIDIKGNPYIQMEAFASDGKAYHRNIPAHEASDVLTENFALYRQMNIITTGGSVEIKISSKGKLIITGKSGEGEQAAPQSHDRKKEHILSDGTRYDFLVALGVSDESGRIFDKKRSKLRQIDRFLQYINNIYPKLPPDGELFVLDLCCGKSYLTFAAYWFLSSVKGRNVLMIGADLKPDVIAMCSEVSKNLGYTGLSFICRDITDFETDKHPALVLSLHACDIATDAVLTAAVRLGADVILSTPCCQHQLMSQVDKSSFIGSRISPILEHSLLKQKFCVALTDALRCKRLQAAGYSVDVTELIDPEDTPKNLLIRAVRTDMQEPEKAEYLRQFKELQALCGTDIFG